MVSIEDKMFVKKLVRKFDVIVYFKIMVIQGLSIIDNVDSRFDFWCIGA